MTPLLSDYYRGLTNWKNLAIGDSGYWNKTTGRISAALDQSTETQNLRNAQFAERISAAQETQILLNSEAQRIMNKYMDQNQQADLFIKAQTLVNLQVCLANTHKASAVFRRPGLFCCVTFRPCSACMIARKGRPHKPLLRCHVAS